MWMIENKLKLNPEKTHSLLVGTSARISRATEPLRVSIANTQVSESSSKSEKLLGIQIESNLKWHKALAELQLKLKSRLADLTKLRSIVPFNVLKTI